MSFTAPGRPVLRYLGGKWAISPKILPLLPPHRTYVEPYAGAASILMRKPRAFSEVYNDKEGDIVNLFRVLRDPRLAKRFKHAVALTPYSREEFELAYIPAKGKIERARRMAVRAYMGFGSSAAHHTATRTGFRAAVTRERTMPHHDWQGWPDYIDAYTERLSGVIIESRPAIKVIQKFDHPETLFYVDPPYVHAVRSTPHTTGKKGHYRHEMTDADHRELCETLEAARGMVVLSGYNNEVYAEYFQGWEVLDIPHYAGASGRADRMERIWINPAASRARQPTLLEVV
jgi:DNA adenine methylase